jgi:hypothetical protein
MDENKRGGVKKDEELPSTATTTSTTATSAASTAATCESEGRGEEKKK